MFDTLQAGQMITITLTSAPRAAANKATLQRLMRLDPTNKKALGRAYRVRESRMTTYNRGNRDWVKRELCARIVTVVKGESFNLRYSPVLLGDLKSVEKFLSLAKA